MSDFGRTYNVEDFIDDVERYSEEQLDLPVIITVWQLGKPIHHSVASMELAEFDGEKLALEIIAGEEIAS